MCSITPRLLAASPSTTSSGREMVRYEGMNQDERGIMHKDFGPPIAWFLDQAGNVLSVLED
jgi:hypothetical protein